MTSKPPAHQPLILAVDDEASNLQLLRHVLQNDYRLLFAKNGERALELARQELPQLILLDVMMPGMTGYETCSQLKADPATAAIPVIFVSALSEEADEQAGFDAGAVDYLTKPLSPPLVRARLRTHLSLARAGEAERIRQDVVRRLGLNAGYDDSETDLHLIRTSHYAHILALAIGMSDAGADELLQAAPMHDVGKRRIPEDILRKPGPLDPAEWKVMQTHAALGGEIIGRHEDGMLAVAHELAVSHHEKWDGSGYPQGLAGEAIPLVGRIVAIADVFDALTSLRPYKQAWTVEQAVAYLEEQRGRHFDARLVNAFLAQMPAVLEVLRRWAER